jgi:hypothetical protein
METPDIDLIVCGGVQQTILDQKRWLLAFSETGNALAACDRTGVSRWRIYQNWFKEPEFQEQFKLAELQHLTRMEIEADRRAMEGVDHPVIHQGVITTTYKEKSDTLLMFRMKKLDPSYRENANQLTINNTNQVEVRAIEVRLAVQSSQEVAPAIEGESRDLPALDTPDQSALADNEPDAIVKSDNRG